MLSRANRALRSSALLLKDVVEGCRDIILDVPPGDEDFGDKVCLL